MIIITVNGLLPECVALSAALGIVLYVAFLCKDTLCSLRM